MPPAEAINIVISRQSEFRIVDPKTEIVLYTHNLPYGATLFMADGAEVKKGDPDLRMGSVQCRYHLRIRG